LCEFAAAGAALRASHHLGFGGRLSLSRSRSLSPRSRPGPRTRALRLASPAPYALSALAMAAAVSALGGEVCARTLAFSLSLSFSSNDMQFLGFAWRSLVSPHRITWFDVVALLWILQLGLRLLLTPAASHVIVRTAWYPSQALLISSPLTHL
jgi:hypothetical protein